MRITLRDLAYAMLFLCGGLVFVSGAAHAQTPTAEGYTTDMPYIEFTSCAGSGFQMMVNEPKPSDRFWLDSNGDGICQEEEKITNQHPEIPRLLGRNTVRLYGAYTMISLIDHRLTQFDVSQCPTLKDVGIGGSYFDFLDMRSCINLESLHLQHAQIARVDLSSSLKFGELEAEESGVQELIAPAKMVKPRIGNARGPYLNLSFSPMYGVAIDRLARELPAAKDGAIVINGVAPHRGAFVTVAQKEALLKKGYHLVTSAVNFSPKKAVESVVELTSETGTGEWNIRVGPESEAHEGVWVDWNGNAQRDGDEELYTKLVTLRHKRAGQKLAIHGAVGVLHCEDNALTKIDCNRALYLHELHMAGNQLDKTAMWELIYQLLTPPVGTRGKLIISDGQTHALRSSCNSFMYWVAQSHGWDVVDFDGLVNMSTNPAIGQQWIELESNSDSPWILTLDWESEHAEVWIDWNNNGELEAGEVPRYTRLVQKDHFGNDIITILPATHAKESKRIRIHGAVKMLDCRHNSITDIQISKGADALETLHAFGNFISHSMLTKIIESLPTLSPAREKNLYMVDYSYSPSSPTVMTEGQVAKAQAKGWDLCDFREEEPVIRPLRIALQSGTKMDIRVVVKDIDATAGNETYADWDGDEAQGVGEALAGGVEAHGTVGAESEFYINGLFKSIDLSGNGLKGIEPLFSFQLRELSVQGNALGYESMQALINSLPMREKTAHGKLYVKDSKNAKEGNVFPDFLSYYARLRHWDVYDWNGGKPERISGFFVTYCSFGGSGVRDEWVAPGKRATAPQPPTREGYVFKGWYTDKEWKNPYNFTSAVTADITLYAKWEEDPDAVFTVTFETGEGTKVASQKVKANGRAIEPPAPTRPRFIFGGWCTDLEGENPFNFSLRIRQSLTLYAKWIPRKYCIVHFDTQGGTPIEDVEVEKGTPVACPPDPTLAGFAFAGWYLDEAYSTPYDFSSKVEKNLRLYANWRSTKVDAVGQPFASPLSVYPNPARERLRISGLRSRSTARIYSVLGELCLAVPVGLDGNVPLRGLHPGLYVLRVEGWSFRVVIEQ